jgi:hypothetical protein
MSEQEIKQAIAIKPNGQILRIGLPRPAVDLNKFIHTFVPSAEPWEVYLTDLPEVIWSCRDDAEYHNLPVNVVATMVIRTIYQNQIDPVRGNVLITGAGTDKDNFVSSVDPKNLEFIIGYGDALTKFLDAVDTQFDVSVRKGV